MYLLIFIVLLAFLTLYFVLVLTIRAYQIKMRLSYPIRDALESPVSKGTDDYRNIFDSVARYKSFLKKRDISYGTFWGKTVEKLFKSNLIRLITFRPLSYNFTMLHMPYGFANLSEISRDKFRTNPKLTDSLKGILGDLSDAIISEKHDQYVLAMARYYRLLRSPDNFLGNIGLRDLQSEQSGYLKEAIEKIKNCLNCKDTFAAYNHILKLKDERIFSALNSFEILGMHYLSSRLECYVQGSYYLLKKESIESHLRNILKHCDDINDALISCNSTDLLKAAA